ncbi:MAG: hypothetical protein ACR2RV_28090 [Verrucomicrobiales bacterium]
MRSLLSFASPPKIDCRPTLPIAAIRADGLTDDPYPADQRLSRQAPAWGALLITGHDRGRHQLPAEERFATGASRAWSGVVL